MIGAVVQLAEEHEARACRACHDLGCGTLAARGGVRPTHEFAFEIEDPVLGRKIAHTYRVQTLPNLG